MHGPHIKTNFVAICPFDTNSSMVRARGRNMHMSGRGWDPPSFSGTFELIFFQTTVIYDYKTDTSETYNSNSFEQTFCEVLSI